MNKLYVLAALTAYTYATATDATECDLTFEANTDTTTYDYAYSWSGSLEAMQDILISTDSDNDGSICYYEYQYDFVIETATVVDATTGDAVDSTDADYDADYYFYAVDATGTSEDDPGFDSTLSMEDAYTDASGSDSTDGTLLTLGDEVTSASDDGDDSTDPYGYTVYAIWMGATQTLDVDGYSNNAVVSAASALTVAAVAGLFF